MKKVSVVALLICLILPCALAGAAERVDSSAQWPAWRGPLATGFALKADPPLKWDENTNVRWKVEIPGSGHASPVVWQDRVFLLTSVPTQKKLEAAAANDVPTSAPAWMKLKKADSVHQFEVLCLDRKTGKEVWKRQVAERAPHSGVHSDSTWASGSPLTDGQRVYAFFGSNGLYCLDMDGKVLWEKDLGKMSVKMNFGEGASPVLAGNALVVNWDHEKGSFIVAFDKVSGKELWRTPREEATSWSTPVAAEVNGGTQVIVSATKRIRAYNATNGAQVWECGGMTQNVIPSPLVENGKAWLMSGFRGAALICVELAQAKDDITSKSPVLWSYNRDTSYVPSPLLMDGRIYFQKLSTEELTCLDAKTGKPFYVNQKLDELKGVYSSPVGAKGRVYITGRNGATAVVEAGESFKLLAVNKLNDNFSASAALAGQELFLRGHKALYCIAEK